MSEKACPKCQQRFPSDAVRCPSDGTLLKDFFAPDSLKHLIGRLIDERYRVLAQVGEGGMGVVFRGVHAFTQRPVAIKVLRAEFASETEPVARFLQEAQSASRIGQENIIEIYDAGILSSGEPYFIMEYLSGENLAQALSMGPFLMEKVIDIGSQICRGLTAAHQIGIIHRDIKPENIFLVPKQSGGVLVKILDFGVAKILDQEAHLTKAGTILGTPQYMSPEQSSGSATDARTDIYSVGVILYEMVTGRQPFVGNSMMSILSKQLLDDPVAPSEIRPGGKVWPALEELILRCLRKEIGARYQSMQELEDALKNALQQSRASSFNPSTVQRIPRSANPLLQDSDTGKKPRIPWKTPLVQKSEVTKVGAPLGSKARHFLQESNTPIGASAQISREQTRADIEDAETEAAPQHLPASTSSSSSSQRWQVPNLQREEAFGEEWSLSDPAAPKESTFIGRPKTLPPKTETPSDAFTKLSHSGNTGVNRAINVQSSTLVDSQKSLENTSEAFSSSQNPRPADRSHFHSSPTGQPAVASELSLTKHTPISQKTPAIQNAPIVVVSQQNSKNTFEKETKPVPTASIPNPQHTSGEFRWGQQPIEKTKDSKDGWQETPYHPPVEGNSLSSPMFRQSMSSASTKKRQSLLLGFGAGLGGVLLFTLIYFLFLAPSSKETVATPVLATSTSSASTLATTEPSLPEVPATTEPSSVAVAPIEPDVKEEPTPEPAKPKPDPIKPKPEKPREKPVEEKSFKLLSNPPSAQVFLNGASLGNTPVSLKAAPKARTFILKKSGYKDASRTIPANRSSLVMVTLDKQAAPVTPEKPKEETTPKKPEEQTPENNTPKKPEEKPKEPKEDPKKPEPSKIITVPPELSQP